MRIIFYLIRFINILLRPLKRRWRARHDGEHVLLSSLRKEEEELRALASVPKEWQDEVFAFRSMFNKKFSRFVVWGLKDSYHTHKFIHRAYYFTARKLGIPTVWLEDEPASNTLLLPGDLVLVVSNTAFPRWVSDSSIRPLPDVHYIFYRTYRHDVICQLKKEQYIFWQEHKVPPAETPDHVASQAFINPQFNTYLYPNMDHPDTQRISAAENVDGLLFNPTLRFLCQPYGTDLLPWEFRPPIFNPDTKKVNYIGSFWSGSSDVLLQFNRYLRTVGLQFCLYPSVTRAKQIDCIRQSRLAPSISGKHVVFNYPPCRMYKNISYGQLGYANVPIHQKLYNTCHPPVGSLEEMTDYVLGMSKDDYISMTEAQQKITQQFTFFQNLRNIFKYF